jgi:hypothetical protein
MSSSSARSHRHTWEPTTVPCAKCAPHPAVRCTDPGCPLHAYPIDITRLGDPRDIEAKITRLRETLAQHAEATRLAYQRWQECSQAQDRTGLDLRTLECHYQQVTALPAEEAR